MSKLTSVENVKAVSRIALISKIDKSISIFARVQHQYERNGWRVATVKTIGTDQVLVYESMDEIRMDIDQYALIEDLRTDIFAYTEDGWDLPRRGGDDELDSDMHREAARLYNWITRKILTPLEFSDKKEKLEAQEIQGKSLAAEMLAKAQGKAKYEKYINLVKEAAGEGRTSITLFGTIGLGDREALANDGFDITINRYLDCFEISWASGASEGSVTIK